MLIAKFLDLERNKIRKFREETITDMLMAGLTGMEQFGISVDYSPNEHVTGADMEWIFAAPRQGPNGYYIRLLLQAKRATFHELQVRDSYWQYAHLNHDRGAQATALLRQAAAMPGTFPMYIFYHPLPALEPRDGELRSVNGINLVPAHLVAPLVQNRCPPRIKQVAYWRRHFKQLKHFLCDRQAFPQAFPLGDVLAFLQAQGDLNGSLNVHPVMVAANLQRQIATSTAIFIDEQDQIRNRARRGERLTSAEVTLLEATFERPVVTARAGIPASIRRSINREMQQEEIDQLERPRIIFYTNRVLESTEQERE